MPELSPPSKWTARLEGVGWAIAILFLLSFVGASHDAELRRRCLPLCLLHPNYAGADRKAIPFVLSDAYGNLHSLDDYKGKVLVLNFWTQNCRPCLDEMPELAELAQTLRNRSDVAFLSISIDEDVSSAMDTLKAVLGGDPPFPVLFDSSAQVVSEQYGTSRFPETWIIDGNGIIRARFDGAREWSQSIVYELVDQIATGGYCPIEVSQETITGAGASVCDQKDGFIRQED